MTDQLERLFVYGTLMPDHGHHRRIQDHVRNVRPATIQGILLDLDAFPALLQGEGIVRGVLLDIETEALRITDRIEGYLPDGGSSLYVRRNVEVDLGDGDLVYAWTYLFAEPSSICGRPRLEVGRIEGTPVFAWPGRNVSTCS